jgi:hypothetical protein
MKPTKLYADLQINPRNKAAYRRLVDYYESIGMDNEAKAFKDLIERKFNDNSANSDEKQ